jgi:hypothetical protein
VLSGSGGGLAGGATSLYASRLVINSGERGTSSAACAGGEARRGGGLSGGGLRAVRLAGAGVPGDGILGVPELALASSVLVGTAALFDGLARLCGVRVLPAASNVTFRPDGEVALFACSSGALECEGALAGRGVRHEPSRLRGGVGLGGSRPGGGATAGPVVVGGNLGLGEAERCTHATPGGGEATISDGRHEPSPGSGRPVVAIESLLGLECRLHRRGGGPGASTSGAAQSSYGSASGSGGTEVTSVLAIGTNATLAETLTLLVGAGLPEASDDLMDGG